MVEHKQYVFLSGLPRTGSTLLSAILAQNPDIHTEGNSAVCQLMWDMQYSCLNSAKEQLLATRRYQTPKDIISTIPDAYYKDVSKKIVVDKCRSWTLPANLDMIVNYITETPKIIVLERPVDEIVDSFVKLRMKNGWSKEAAVAGLQQPDSEPIMRSLSGVNYAKQTGQDWFLFITYKDLVEHTEDTLARIYDFCGWAPYQHDLTNIVNNHPEDDSVYGLHGHHDIRPTINYATKEK